MVEMKLARVRTIYGRKAAAHAQQIIAPGDQLGAVQRALVDL
jgi:hypothetical protein